MDKIMLKWTKICCYSQNNGKEEMHTLPMVGRMEKTTEIFLRFWQSIFKGK